MECAKRSHNYRQYELILETGLLSDRAYEILKSAYDERKTRKEAPLLVEAVTNR